MEQRLNYLQVAPEALKIMFHLEAYLKNSNFDVKLVHLVKTRASQINGCAACLDMHVKEAIQDGETPQRIGCLSAWQDTPFYSEKEKAALALTEAVTLISTKRVSDDLYNHVRKHFSEKEYVDLVMMINAINNWNRLNIASSVTPKLDS